mmetsp:Transcript_17482/g.35680  ORF Transcript_17482/g.35680 Transcript_17482/m.35680 type:complete len:618 (-) Transcript_17482:128-1981(-)
MALEAARNQLQTALANPPKTGDSSKENRRLLASMQAAAETEMVGVGALASSAPPGGGKERAFSSGRGPAMAMGARGQGRSRASLTGFTMVHLALWAQVGVLGRFWISEGINASCWDLVVLDPGESRRGCSRAEDEMRSVMGILVANVLGSLLMGFFTENKSHKLWFEAPKMPVSFLPENHFIQHHEELLTGLRVGFCGSMTTFASWAFQMVSLLSRGFPGAMLLVLFIEMSAATVAFLLGEHLAIRVHMWVVGIASHAGHKAQRVSLWHQIRQNAIFSAINRQPNANPPPPPAQGKDRDDDDNDEDDDGNDPPSRAAAPPQGDPGGAGGPIAVIESGQGDELWILRSGGDLGASKTASKTASGSGSAADGSTLAHFSAGAEKYSVTGPIVLTSANLARKRRAGTGSRDVEKGDGKGEGADAVNGGGKALRLATARSGEGPTRLQEKYIRLLNAAATAALLGVTVAMACLLRFDEDFTRRKCWLALLFAPFGCFLRWRACLGFNAGVFPGRLSWFPAGTFAINVAATALTSTAAAVEVHLCASAANLYWLALALGAFQTGFDGALSTVSTFVGEVHKYMLEYPRNYKGWLYLAASFAAAIFAGFCCYSWSVLGPDPRC